MIAAEITAIVITAAATAMSMVSIDELLGFSIAVEGDADGVVVAVAVLVGSVVVVGSVFTCLGFFSFVRPLFLVICGCF